MSRRRCAVADDGERRSSEFSRRQLVLRLTQLLAVLSSAGLAASCPGGSEHRKRNESGGTGDGNGGITADGGRRLEFLARFTPRYNVTEVTLEGRSAYLVHNYDETTKADQWLALDRRCTHTGCKIAFAEDEREFHCPCHGSRFNMEGYPVAGPAKKRLTTWTVEHEGERVYVIVD